ncbi:MAG: glucuronate isomerase [Acholeplasmatales bacterium]|jgi:glucuronate isomerase|nr:glucuronate isomerase [Acholeplasmatales bacterium]
MKNPIAQKNFLLNSKLAQTLYKKYAKDLPIIDFHCHLSPKEIYENKQFKSLYEVWLSGDHYKWRLMRANGINEDHITGQAPDYDKFYLWAKTVPLLVGSPLYHWTHLELKAFFQENRLLNEQNAQSIYDQVNEQLKTKTAHYFINSSKVQTICTTDDPLDDLQYHQAILKQNNSFQVLPAWRPDKLVNINLESFLPYLAKLELVAKKKIKTFDNFLAVIEQRLIYFHENHCRLSDHALDSIDYLDCSTTEAQTIFTNRLNNIALSDKEVVQFKSYILNYLGKLYFKYGWSQQYHIGALRNVSTNKFQTLGPDTGNDAIQDGLIARGLAGLLNSLDKTDQLPKTTIYTLNPRDFEVAITIMQCFQANIAGKIQFGAAWWFLDNIDGMEKQLSALANNGLLAKFVGMLTDSRSFLSYPRHDYFRRILCNFLANQVKKGLYPLDIAMLGKIVQDISYYNAKEYFGV